MSTVSTPVMAWIASIVSGTAYAASSFITATINVTNGWEIQLPFAFKYSFYSSQDAEVSIYASMDGGATYDTNALTSISIAGAVDTKAQTSIRLSTGQYAVKILNPGPNSGTAFIGTAVVITGILNQ